VQRTTASGASRPLRRIPAIVSFLNPQPALSLGTHTDAQIAAIAASIKEWGWTTPALVGEDGGLIAGHARILAARQLGIAEIPVMVAAGWTEAQKRAYVLADNQLAITGSGWDTELLRLETRKVEMTLPLAGDLTPL
jgi:ParB-like chromosome segregation protein Spo0J